jgi:hypothetical protein
MRVLSEYPPAPATSDPVYLPPTALYVAGACCLGLAALAAVTALCAKTSSNTAKPAHNPIMPRADTAKWVNPAKSRVPQAGNDVASQSALRSGSNKKKSAKAQNVVVQVAGGKVVAGAGPNSSSQHSAIKHAQTTESGGVITACSDSHTGGAP